MSPSAGKTLAILRDVWRSRTGHAVGPATTTGRWVREIPLGSFTEMADVGAVYFDEVELRRLRPRIR